MIPGDKLTKKANPLYGEGAPEILRMPESSRDNIYNSFTTDMGRESSSSRMAGTKQTLQNRWYTPLSVIKSLLAGESPKNLVNNTIPKYSVNNSAASEVISNNSLKPKNKYGPYRKGYSIKSEYPVRNVAPLYNNIPEGESTLIPKAWMNARAGDPEYSDQSLSEMMSYVNNPSNGWTEDNTGKYRNIMTDQVFDPDIFKSSVNTPMYVYKKPNVTPNYFPMSRYAAIPDIGSDILGLVDKNDPELSPVYNQDVKSTIDPSTSTSFAAYTNATNNYGYPNILNSNHEINHAMTFPYTSAGLVHYVYDPNNLEGSSIYAKRPEELVNHASLFQQQHYRNTGRRITDKAKFLDDINNAKQNIKDYDPESRRFLQSIDILQNQASDGDRGAADMLNQIQEAMPLITSRGYNKNYRGYV